MPKYEDLAQKLRGRILEGVYAPGQKIPSENELCAREGLSRQTVRQALGLLEQEGRIERRRGSGSIVRGVPRPRTRTVAVITTYIGEYIFPDILRGIQETLAQSGYAPLLWATHNRVDSERDILESLLTRPADGVIVEGTKTALPNPNLGLYRKLQAMGVPLVFLNGFYPELDPAVYVVADDQTGGGMAARYLLGRGHTRIAGIFKGDDIQGHRRYAGYAAALREAGAPAPDERVLWFTTETRDTLLRESLPAVLEGCTAAVAYNDETAVQMLRLLRERGVRVPHDLALVSFDDSVFAALASPPLTSLALGDGGREELGRLAARKLLRLISGESGQPAVMPWRMSEKNSV